jgi:hypothetical protein
VNQDYCSSFPVCGGPCAFPSGSCGSGQVGQFETTGCIM